MIKKITAIIISLIFVSLLTPSVWSFHRDDNGKRSYDRENSTKSFDEGGYKGGHDAITNEAMLLKKDVHQQTDPDGGTDFNNKMVQKALPSLRTGAHDEDATKWGVFGYPDGEKPIGPNGDGDYFKHFYNPNTGKGLWGNESAIERAIDYVNGIKKKLENKQTV